MYVVEFDWKLNGPSGDNFYMLYSEGNAPPWSSGVALRTISNATDWIFQVDTGADPFFALSPTLQYNQVYHITVHARSGPTKPVDVYIDGALLGTYASRNPELATQLIQWGDPSGGAGFGNATVDNISIGGNVPEPGCLALAAVAMSVALPARRRATICN